MSLKHDTARVLLKKAREEARFLAVVLADTSISNWIYGFHAQQTVEKALKAVLSWNGVEFPRTHDLTELVALIADIQIPLPPDHDRLDELTPYGSTLRYDDEEEVAMSFDRVWVRASVERTLTWAEALLQPKA
jgi:HEPN domain-containing protein